MADLFVVLAGSGSPDLALDALAGSGLGASASLSAAGAAGCCGLFLLPPAPPAALAAARRVAAAGLPVFSFGGLLSPPPLSSAGAWLPVAGVGAWAAAWRWVPAVSFAS